MVKAKLRTKQGIEIEVEADKETLKELVDFLEKREERQTGILSGQPISKESTINKNPRGPTSAILHLKTCGFLKQPQTMAAIQKKLIEEGYHYPITSLSAVLLMLIRRRELGRLKEKGAKRWGYVER